jgi:hypothetical protein
MSNDSSFARKLQTLYVMSKFIHKETNDGVKQSDFIVLCSFKGKVTKKRFNE